MLVEPFSFTFHIPSSNYKTIFLLSPMSTFLGRRGEGALHPSLLSKQEAAADLSGRAYASLVLTSEGQSLRLKARNGLQHSLGSSSLTLL